MPQQADLVIRNIGRLVTCTPTGADPLGVIERGALVASEGRIVWVGPERDLDVALGSVEDVDAGGNAVLPGLVDCHTHLVFAGDRIEEFGARLRGTPYAAGGVQGTVEATRAATDDELLALALERLDTFLEHGVTTVEAKSGYGLTAEHEERLLRVAVSIKHPVKVVRTYMGAHIPAMSVDEICSQMATIGNLAEFADVWCDEGAFDAEQTRAIARAARTAGLGLKIHAEQLSHSGGAAIAAEFGAVSADHLEHATEADADALSSVGTIGVLLPGASMMTGAAPAPARMLIERGVRVAVSTDFNPGTSYSENLQLQIALACTQLKMTPEEAILGVTRNAAAALGREGQIGSLEVGGACDVMILQSRSELDLAYHYGVNLADRVITGRGPDYL